MRRIASPAWIVLAVPLLAATMLAGCAAGRPSAAPSISGVVRQIAPGADASGATLLIEGSGRYDKASVRIDAKTSLLRTHGDGVEAALIREIVAGERIEVWFDGPVAESYPVQAHAATVILAPIR